MTASVRQVAGGGAPVPALPGLTAYFVVAIAILTALSGSILLCLLGTTVAVYLARTGQRSPALSFALLVCALYPSTGLAYFGVTGSFPGGSADARFVPEAYALLYVGLALIMTGYRVAADMLGGLRPPQVQHDPVLQFAVRPGVVALAIFVVYLPEWVGIRMGGPSLGGLSQIANHTLAFRSVLLAYYLLVVFSLQDNKSIVKCVLVLLYVGVPLSASAGSGWSGVFLFSAIVGSYALTLYRVDVLRLMRRHPSLFAMSLAGLAFLVTFGLVWEGGLKASWRAELRAGTVGGGTIERLSDLQDQFSATYGTLHLSAATERLTARMSSGQGYFSYVLSREGVHWDHTWGELTAGAIVNLVPRILWADKPNLGGDSWMVQRFAGLQVAGDAQGTSIGLGFVPQFYIEAGLLGVPLGCFAFGVLFAISHCILRMAARSRFVGDVAFIVVAMENAYTYDASYIKMLNPILYQSVVFAALLVVLRQAFPLVWAWRGRTSWLLRRPGGVPRGG